MKSRYFQGTFLDAYIFVKVGVIFLKVISFSLGFRANHWFHNWLQLFYGYWSPREEPFWSNFKCSYLTDININPNQLTFLVLRIRIPHLSFILELVWMKSFLLFTLFSAFYTLSFSIPRISRSTSFLLSRYFAISWSWTFYFYSDAILSYFFHTWAKC